MRSASKRGFWPLLLLVGVLGAGPALQPAPDESTGSVVYRQALAATAWVHAPDRGKGTGWLLDASRRWLVTSYHVVSDNDTVDVFFPCPGAAPGSVITERSYYFENLAHLRKKGLAVRGRVVRRSPRSDLAVVELASLPPGVTPLRLAINSARPGDRVQVVGNRYDCAALWSCTTGVVRQVHTLREGYFNGGRQLAKGTLVIVAQTPINEGDSGAALVNERGEVVGVAAAVAWETQGAGLFIDVRLVRELAKVGPETNVSPPEVPAPPAVRPAPRDIYRQGLRSLTVVQAPGSDRWSSGWLLDRRRRLLITTHEAVAGRETVDVTWPVYQDGAVVAETAFFRQQDRLLRQKKARGRGVVLAGDARRNLALLELESVPEEAVALRFAAAAPLPGDRLHALGSPARGAALWLYTAASVRQLGHVNLGQTAEGPDPAVVLVQAPLGEGEGGGPLLNGDGELVGVVSGKSAPQQQLCYALAASEVQNFLAETRPARAPRTADEYVRRGRLFLKAGQSERAVLDLNEAIRLDRRHAPAHAERARAHRLLGDSDRALADCDTALRIDPRLTAAYCERAAVLCDRGQVEKALAGCAAALRIDPHSALAFSVRGRARLLHGDVRGALGDCDEAIWLDRKLPAAHLCRGMAHARQDDHDKAIADYTQALRLDPRMAEAYRRRGDSWWAKSDVKAALEDYSQARTLAPGDAAAVCGCGRAHAARGDHDRALADFNEALRLGPRHASAYLGRGGERLRRGDLERGLADCTKALTHDPRLAADFLADVDARAAELLQGDLADPGAAAELCRRALELVKPFVKDRATVVKAIDSGQAMASAEPDPRRRAEKLRAAITATRDRLRSPDD